MKKTLYYISSLLILACSCEESLDTAFDKRGPISTDYPVESRVFYDEFLAQGEINGEMTFSETGFYMSSTMEMDSKTARKYVADQFDGKFFRAWIDGLETGTNYYVKAYGKTGDGKEYEGRTIRVTTSADIIEYVKVGALPGTEKSVNGRHHLLSGVVTDFGQDKDGVIEYGAYCRPAGSGEDWQVTTVVPDKGEIKVDTPFEVLVTGLTPESSYEYMIYARNNRKEQFSETGTFTTGSTSMPSVAFNKMENVATTLFSVSGTVTDYGNDPDVECGFYFGTSEGSMSEQLLSDEIDEADVFIVRKRGLTKETKYFIRPFVRNYSGEATGETVSLMTGPESAPHLEVVLPTYKEILRDVTTSSLKLKAYLNSDGGLEVQECGVYYGKDPESLDSKAKGEISGEYADSIYVDITGLNSGEVIYYRFFAKNAKGEYAAPMESAGTKIEIPAWENAGANMDAGAPNNWIQRSATLTEVYYEQPPVTVTESDGKKYKYYFLDRNLGATKVVESASVSNNMDMIGSCYVYSYPKPGAVPSTGTVAQAKFGYINSNPIQKGCLNWNEPQYTPAPANYFIPTRAEWRALIEALPESQRNLTGVFRLIRIGKTGNRPQNGGVFQKSIHYATLFCADNDKDTGIRATFQARDTDSDSEFSGAPYMVVAVDNTSYINSTLAERGGASVRCFRKMAVE